MPFYHCYRPHRFRGAAREMVDRANAIIDDMSRMGYRLTLRQLYYRFVAKGWLPNRQSEYRRLGAAVTAARECGEMDWYAIEDRGREHHMPYSEEDPESILSGIEDRLKYDRWERQDDYVEVWVEKQALESVVARPCDRLDVPYMACKGYLSASEAWRAGVRFADALARGKRCTLIHLADHDPSGLDMTRDNTERVWMFAEDSDVDVRRIALNMDQVQHYGPPPNPAKLSDSRARDYVRRYGRDSWELDALEPGVLDILITEVVKGYIDQDRWDSVDAEEREARRPLEALGNNWDAVREFLEIEGYT